jgi:hypothetical protein
MMDPRAAQAIVSLENENAKLRENYDYWRKEAGNLLTQYENGHRAFLTVRDERDSLRLQINEVVKRCEADCKGDLIECAAGDCWPCSILKVL